MSFSAFHRSEYVDTLKQQTFDLLVVGGGITGAGIALDAAVRGLSVALVEKNDFGSGTSSRSTKLIHGGLRYLKQLEFGLVREVGKERAIVYRNAPHIVIPEKMLLPIVEGGSLGKYSSSLGLYVYDRLAKVRSRERRKMLSKEETLAKEPLLREDILRGGGIYIEYRSDDSRLVIEAMKTAVERGAVCINYTQLNDFLHQDGKVAGGIVTDHISGENYEIKARTTINACGPWVDTLRKKEGSLKGKRLLLTKGIHLVVPQERLPLKASVYFDVPTDKRMIFAIPRGEVVYVGTTDTVYNEDMEHPFTTFEDAEYVLNAANYMFPGVDLTMDDVESSWAGLRPLIHEEGKDPSEVSRKDEIFFSESGLISIAGGKLTGYRKMAERAVDESMELLKAADGRSFVKSSTEKVTLSGGNLDGLTGVRQYIAELTEKYPVIPAEEIEKLAFKYGDATGMILDRHAAGEPGRELVLTELDYCMEEEQVTTVGDFLIRRTGRLFFERPALEASYKDLHQYICDKLGYDAALRTTILEAFEKEYYGVMAFRKPSGKAASHA